MENTKLYTVLIVEDEPDVRELMKEMLDDSGLFSFIILATDGSEAWSKIQNQDFDLIILDINMPKKSGFDIIDLLHAHKRMPKQRVLVSSGHLDSLGVKRAIDKSVSNFLIKPYTEEVFMDKVKKALEDLEEQIMAS